MREGKDIVAISIPFSAGVALAAYLPSGTVSSNMAVAASCMASAVFAAMFCRKGDNTAVCLLMFFSLGLLCCFSAREAVVPAREPGGLPERALGALTSVIDGCGFGYGQTGPLVKALITGQREDLDMQTIEAFRQSGAAHILSLSGLHMGVIYGILHKSLSWMGKSIMASIMKSVLTIGASWFFMTMTGAGPSVTRAFLFILINELARLSPGRKRRPANVLCAALTIQLTFDPLCIRSLSFQLSYLAMLAIVTLFPAMDSWYPDNGTKGPMRRIWTSAALSISCQLFTAPLAWWHFRTIPPYFLISNLVALPLSEMLIVCSAVTVAAQAAGFCPEMLKGLTDILAQALVKSLEIVSSL